MTIEENAQMENNVSGNLLTVEERVACETLAEGDSLQRRRAKGLLAFDDGATQKEASEQAGLTLGQLKYWLKKFRNGRMTIFPAEEPAPSDDPPPQPVEVETAVTPDQPDDPAPQPDEMGKVTVPSIEIDSEQAIVFSDKKTKKTNKVKAKKAKKEKKAKPTKKTKKDNKKTTKKKSSKKSIKKSSKKGKKKK